ncbi:hypothetical protein V9T40_011959 [Parthenolecanium corni]|uniref:separase n=1 Tax=Parthenolecanium corni TaxID=536013 RepID=A0AAN9Y016_9HEMI
MDLNSLISNIELLILENKNHLNGTTYEELCKLAAGEYFSEGRDNEGIFYLSEAHAASVRVETLFQYEICTEKHQSKGTAFAPNLEEKYLEFTGEYVQMKYEGLCRRLAELPKEWTIVQLTRSYSPSDLWTRRQKGAVPQMRDLHVTRLSCGGISEPCHVLIPQPFSDEQDGTTSILQMLHDVTLDRSLHMRTESAAKIKAKRLQNCVLLRNVVREIQTQWIKEWCCLFLGRLCDEELEELIDSRLKQAFEELKFEVTPHIKRLLLHIASGCAHLSEEDIDVAVSQIINDPSAQKQVTDCIYEIKKENLIPVKTKRHPVILIVDQKLETVPWEACPVLKHHPVSRLPSIHYVHAIFKHHEDTIVNGNKILSTPLSGFYIINPDLTLQNTEKRIVQFLNMRSSNWEGLIGKSPSPTEFQNVLTSKDLLLYCGHGNGTQYLNSYSIQELNVKALPFLFGCSSVQYNDIGGRLSFRSLSNSYLMASSPCALGMLWNVTNTDTDYMALTLLNHWLPGKPVDLKNIEGFGNAQYEGGDLQYKEPELLRVLKVTRDSAKMFTNGAALVVYGIPVKLMD